MAISYYIKRGAVGPVATIDRSRTSTNKIFSKLRWELGGALGWSGVAEGFTKSPSFFASFFAAKERRKKISGRQGGQVIVDHLVNRA